MKRARDVRDQVIGLMEKVEIELESNSTDYDAIKKALTSGFFYHTANLQRDKTYKVSNNHLQGSVMIHPGSTLAKVEPPPPWVIYHELVLTK